MNNFKDYQELSPSIVKKLVYPSSKIDTPFGNKKVLYADYIASGKPSPIIEKYISKNIYSKYSNTHSNASNGICMKNEIERVRDIIKKEYNINDDYEILFKGSGTTGAINYLIHCLDYSKYKEIFIFISSYEHYSNHLTWLELKKKYENMNLFIIPLNEKNELNVEWFDKKISEITKKPKQHTLIISSIIHCSNLTGYFLPLSSIKKTMDKYEHPNITKYLFSDFACSAPYKKINGKMYDAFFFSGHKFIGGVETPGVLVAKTCLFEKNHSTEPGGSCIKKTHYNKVIYSQDIEIRESAGTPNIIGIIKLGQCFLLKKHYQSLIDNNEHILLKIMRTYTKYFMKKYETFFSIVYEKQQMPIFTFSLKNLHYNYVVVLLNDLFGIQSRGGRSCSGLFTDFIKDKYGIDGFCRISLHYLMSVKDVQYIFNSVEFIINHGEEFKHLYEYDEKNNLFHCSQEK